MTQVDHVREDLHYVRTAVGRRGAVGAETSFINYLWAGYVLAEFALIDVNPRYANLFALIALPVCLAASFWIHSRIIRKRGEIDRLGDRQSKLFWIGGVLLCVAATIGAVNLNPVFLGVASGQLSLMLFGMLYFAWGVFKNPSFIWLGVLVVACAVVVCRIPHYSWTVVGVVVAGGLIVSGLSTRHAAACGVAQASDTL